MAETTKFTEEELSEIKKLQELYNTVVYQAGQVYLDGLTLKNKENQVKSNIEEVKKQEENIISSLTKTYGVGSINLETGEFTPIED